MKVLSRRTDYFLFCVFVLCQLPLRSLGPAFEYKVARRGLTEFYSLCMSYFIHHRAAPPTEESTGWLTGTKKWNCFRGEVKGAISRWKWKEGLKGQEVLPRWALAGTGGPLSNPIQIPDNSTPGTEANRCDTTTCRNSERDDQGNSKYLTDLPLLSTGMELGSPGRLYRCHLQQIILIWSSTYQRENSFTSCVFLLLFTQVSSKLSSSSLFLTL